MGAPRKPTAQLELVGAFKKNPQRRREYEPQCLEDVMLPPVELGADELVAWDFLVECAVEDVLTKMDSACLALVAKAVAVAWKPGAKVDEMYKAVNLLGKLGMTPADRSKIVVPKKDKPNPFAAFKKA
jgi:hypothetical protein